MLQNVVACSEVANGADVDAIPRTALTKFGTTNDRITAAEHAWIFLLQHLIGRAGLILGLLRRNLHHIGATGDLRGRGGAIISGREAPDAAFFFTNCRLRWLGHGCLSLITRVE